MDLTPRQLSSLDEMGIPVWALRSENSNEDTVALGEKLLPCECVILLESVNPDQKSQQLLQAMLFSIGLNLQQCVVINADQLSQLQDSASQQKLLLILGQEFAHSLWGKSAKRGECIQLFEKALQAVVSFSLDELLNSPENKALAWQDLLLAKQIIDAS